MKVLFYVPPFRDRDFWPIARSALTAGHDVYYVLVGQTSAEDVIEADRRLGFDLVFSEDRAARLSDGNWLNMRLTRQPALIEVVVNDLAEIAIEMGDADGSFSSLTRNRVCVGAMDRDLLDTARAFGVPVVWLPYGVLSVQLTDATYFAATGGQRRFGEIHAGDFTSIPGAEVCERTTDVVFMGECKPGPNRPLFDYLVTHCFPSTTMDELLAADGPIRGQIAIDAEPYDVRPGPIADAVRRHGPTVPDDDLGRMGFALLKEHYEEQVRVMRRLAYLRRLTRELGDRLALYGDDFIALGLPARPTDHESNERKYLRSKIGIDFGCTAYECSLDHRPTRILSCGSVVLQFRRGDSVGFYGGLTERMTFDSPHDLVSKIEHVLGSADAARSLLSAEQDLGATACGMDTIVREFLATKPWSVAFS